MKTARYLPRGLSRKGLMFMAPILALGPGKLKDNSCDYAIDTQEPCYVNVESIPLDHPPGRNLNWPTSTLILDISHANPTAEIEISLAIPGDFGRFRVAG